MLIVVLLTVNHYCYDQPHLTTSNIAIIPNTTINTNLPKIYLAIYSGLFGYLMVMVLVGLMEVVVVIFVAMVQVLLVGVKVAMVVLVVLEVVIAMEVVTSTVYWRLSAA